MMNSKTRKNSNFSRPSNVRSRRLLIPGSKDHLVQKLILRETYGHVRTWKRPTRREAWNRFFTMSLPARMAYCLSEVVPMSAIEAGHIFMGFSKCGQFLLSYTQTPTDIDLTSSSHVEYIQYNYRLHWWLFVPGRKAKKVAEILLFSDGGTHGHLQISFCQWPDDMTKLVVYGAMAYEIEGLCDPGAKPCYMTVTAVPSLNACKDCAKVAASYGDDDVAEAWNSCVRLSCLEHGMTVHTTFDLVSPYPTFEPKINLKRTGHVIINTGNLLHSVYIHLEDLVHADQDKSSGSSYSNPNNQSKIMKWSQQQVCTTELSISTASQAIGEVFSPPMASPASFFHHSDSETTDCESDYGGQQLQHQQQGQVNRNSIQIRNEDRLERVNQIVNKVYNRTSPYKMPSTTEESPSTLTSSAYKKSMAEKAYELTDDDFDDGVREKLSTFRKKRLAEKTYEFRDEDSENVTPFHRKQQQPPQPEPTIKSPRSSSEYEESILRPIFSNNSSTSPLSLTVPDQISPSSQHSIGFKQQQSLFSPRSSISQQHGTSRFHAKYIRRYLEMDDEMVSVITDIEDEDVSGYPYHAALPLEVHGSGYQPLNMISNSKAGKINGRCLKVVQRSFDLEVFCHHMAQKLCQAVNIKYWFCNDYDVEIIDIDPETGDVIMVAVVLIQATMFIKKVNNQPRPSTSTSSSPTATASPGKSHPQQYQGYETSFTFCWNMDSTECTLIDSEPLKEVTELSEAPDKLWHPAKELSVPLQKKFNVTYASGVKCFTNEAVLKGTSMKTIIDSDHLLAIINDNANDRL